MNEPVPQVEPVAGPSRPGAQVDPISRRVRWLAFAGILVLVGVVVLSVRRPPILDLGQQLSQVRDLAAWANGSRPDLRLNPTGPNKLVYPLLALGLALGGERGGPALAALLVAATWLAALHLLAADRARPLANAVLASALLFGSAFYAGFFSFLLGLVALAFWSRELRSDPSRVTFAVLAGRSFLGALLLYYAHALWFVFGGFLVATWVLLFRFSRRELFARLVGGLPVACLAAAWSAASAEFVRHSWFLMLMSPAQRIGSLHVLSTVFFGGMRGPAEVAMTGFVLCWLAFGLARAVRQRGLGVDGFLLLAGSIALLAALFLPDRVDWTLMMAWRWGGVAAVLLILALPQPGIVGERVAVALAGVALLACFAVTARAWSAFEREEMAGFEQALAAVPRGASVLGLDLDRTSPRFYVPPYFQMFAYAAVERSSRTNFSFAELPSSLVVTRDPWAERGWNRGLEWEPETVQPRDLAAFERVLLHGTEAQLDHLRARLGPLEPVAGSGRWHLLRSGGDPGNTR